MTAVDEVHDAVAGTEPADWIQFRNKATWTLREDVAVRIVREDTLESPYVAPWTRRIQARCENYGYYVYYGDAPVEYHAIVSVDNFRAHIPMPSDPAGPNQAFTISPFQATLGRVVTGDRETFNAYLNRTGVQVRGTQ